MKLKAIEGTLAQVTHNICSKSDKELNPEEAA